MVLSALPLLLIAAGSFHERRVEVGGRPYPYQVFVGERSGASPLPVILYLHGAGESGDDGAAQTLHGLGPALRRHPGRFPALVVFPQCPRGRAWFGSCERAALAALDRSIEEFGGDRGRIVVTGLSLGGYGAYQLAARHPGRFAGVAPVAGGVVPPRGFVVPREVEEMGAAGDVYLGAMRSPDAHVRVARMIGRTPAWIVHGAEDAVVPVGEARGMARALEGEGAPVTYVELPGRGHAIGADVYLGEDLARWLVSLRRSR